MPGTSDVLTSVRNNSNNINNDNNAGNKQLKSIKITNLSSSDDRPIKQVFFILLIATSVPLHFPWYTVPKVPEPNSFNSSRSSFIMI